MLELKRGLTAAAYQLVSSDQEVFRLATKSSVEAAGALLDRRVEPDVENLGGAGPYWEAFKREFYSLVCTDNPKYADARKKLSLAEDGSFVVALTSVAGVISRNVGLPETIAISSFVGLAFSVLGQITVGAWCSAAAGAFEAANSQPLKLKPESEHQRPPTG